MVTRIRQRRAAIDIGCGGEVGRHAKPDDRHGSPQSRQRLRHQHDPPAIRVLDGDRAVLGPVGILRLHRQMAERGQPGSNLFHLGQIVEIEHERVVPAGRRTRAAVIVLGELRWYRAPGSPSNTQRPRQPARNRPIAGVHPLRLHPRCRPGRGLPVTTRLAPVRPLGAEWGGRGGKRPDMIAVPEGGGTRAS